MNFPGIHTTTSFAALLPGLEHEAMKYFHFLSGTNGADDLNLSPEAAFERLAHVARVRFARAPDGALGGLAALELFDGACGNASAVLCTVSRARVCMNEVGDFMPMPPEAASCHRLDVCTACGVHDAPLSKCAACGQVAYCGKACQRKDWPSHKPRCAALKEMSHAERLPEGHPLAIKGREHRMTELLARVLNKRAHKLRCSPHELNPTPAELAECMAQVMREIP
jgi:hypothetical protein